MSINNIANPYSPPFDVITDVTGSRALATSYQAGATPLFVLAIITNAAGVPILGYMDSFDPPTTSRSQSVATAIVSTVSVFMIVPPNWYYRITSAGATIVRWCEYS